MANFHTMSNYGQILVKKNCFVETSQYSEFFHESNSPIFISFNIFPKITIVYWRPNFEEKVWLIKTWILGKKGKNVTIISRSNIIFFVNKILFTWIEMYRFSIQRTVEVADLHLRCQCQDVADMREPPDSM